jgi:uncharacterized membrane protein YagU involved in acid resistance
MKINPVYALIAAVFLGYAAAAGAVIWVAWHFISKWW